MNLLSGHKLHSWMQKSLQMTATDPRCQPEMKEVLQTYYRLGAHGLNHIPLNILIDLVCCLNPEKLRFRSDSGNESFIVQKYERECLNRIIQLPRLNEALELIQSSHEKKLIRERLIYLLLKPLAVFYPGNTVFNPAEVREVSALEEEPEEEFPQEKLAENLQTFLKNLTDMSWNSMLTESDIFELSNLNLLKTDHLRLGCRQIITVKNMFTEITPGQLTANDNEDEADSSFIDETHYPAGGLAGLTNKGPIENMVSSELSFLDEQVGHLNLFDIRYLENQQLFFMRDSGTLRRRRRKIHFIFDLNRLFEQKSRGYEWQFSILTQALCYRLLEDFFAIFERDAVIAELHYISGECPFEFINGEMNLMKLLLKDHCLHGRVSFKLHNSNALPEMSDSKRKCYSVIFTADNLSHWQKFLNAYEEQLIPVKVHFSNKESDSNVLNIDGAPFEEIERLRDKIMAELVS